MYFHDAAHRMYDQDFESPLVEVLRKHAALRDELERSLIEMRAVWKIDKDINDAYA